MATASMRSWKRCDSGRLAVPAPSPASARDGAPGGAQPAWRRIPSSAIARSFARWILVPFALCVTGNASRQTIRAGTLYFAMRARQCAMAAASSSVAPGRTITKATGRVPAGGATPTACAGGKDEAAIVFRVAEIAGAQEAILGEGGLRRRGISEIREHQARPPD